jgi:hypothetical protein
MRACRADAPPAAAPGAASRRARRGPRRLLAIALLAGWAALATGPSAHAGSYVIENCPAAPAGNGDAGPWSIFGSPQGAKASCGGGTGDYIGPRGGNMSPGVSDGVQVTVPAAGAITIREAKIWWYVPHQSSGATTFALATSSDGILGESTTTLDRRVTPDVFTLPSGSTRLALEDYCANDDAGQGCGFGEGENPNLELHGSQLTLQENRLPDGTVTGGAPAGGSALSGIQTIGYDSEDADSGVRLVTLQLDGQTVAQHDYLAECTYASFAACPPGESGGLSWDTASVADGTHTLTLTVQDAAQNTRAIDTTTILTSNHGAPAASAGLTALPGPGSVIAFAAGAANGVGASRSAQLTLDGPRGLTLPYAHRGLSLAGRLRDPAGQSIANATLDIMEEPSTGGQPRLVGHCATRGDGVFAAAVPAGPSRRIEIGYRAFAGEPAYDAQVALTETVAAGVHLQITPRDARSNGAIRLAGAVSGPIPAHGVMVELLVHYRGVWEPFRAPRTNAAGHFHVSYRFQGAIGRFPFRAEVPPAQAAFPYGRGQSETINVTAR